MRDFPQLIIAPVLLAVVWRTLFERHHHLDTDALLATHIDLLIDAIKAPGHAAGHERRRRGAMKRIAALIGALVLAAGALVLTTYTANEDAEFPGYMEADLVLVGSEQGGRIDALAVEEGDSVKQGDPVFTLESSEQEAAVAAAKARVAEAEARLADAKAEVQRPGEIEVLEAALAEAKAMLQGANNNLDRARTLFDKGWTTKAQLDDAVAQHDRNQAAVAEAEKRIAAAKLPGRSDMIDAAAASAEAARYALAEAEKSLAKRKVVSPASGTIEEVYFRPGEVVKGGPGRHRAAAAAQSESPLLRR